MVTWLPKSEKDIATAIDDGNLKENVALDVKRLTGDTNSARGETAKDLASFAIYGGALLIGVDELKDQKSFELAPQALKGLAEKVEQIASNRIDPPLFIRVTEIPSDADPDVGYLYVEVPPSPTAPHMVEGRYYARGDRTTRRLTDNEIVLLHQSRRRSETFVLDLLRQEVERDPWAGSFRREQAHMFLIAEPLQGRRGMLTDVVRSQNNADLFGLLQRSERLLDPDIAQYSPTLTSAAWWTPRAKGLAATSFPNGVRQPTNETAEKNALDIEVQEDGGVRVFCGRLSDTIGRTQNDETRVLLEGIAVAYTWRIILWADQIAQASGYRGSWGFGFGATKLLGLVSYSSVDAFGTRSYPYDRDTYEEAATASLQEIQDSPGSVVNRLVGQLMRGVGSAAKYAHLLR